MKIKNLKSAWYWTTACTALLVTIISLTSLIWLKSYTRNRSQELFEKSMAQFQLRMETYLGDFQRVAKEVSYYSSAQTVLFGGDTLKRMKAGKLLAEQTSWISESCPNIKDLFFLTDENTIYALKTYYGVSFYRTIRKLGQETDFSSVQPSFQYLGSIETSIQQKEALFLYIMPVYSLLGDKSFDHRALCVAVGDFRDLPEMGNDFDAGYEALLILEGDTLLYSSPAEGRETDILYLPRGWEEDTQQGRRMLTFRTQLQNTPWDVAAIATEEIFLKDSYPIQRFLILLLVLSLGVMFLIMLWAIRMFSVPIQELKRDLELVGAQAEGEAFLVPANIEEIDWIRHSINEMITRIVEERQKQYQSEERLYQATILANQSLLRYYQSQINPHFLYNSLECIRSIAQLRGVEEISEISLALARLFRYSIDGRAEVPLEVELGNVQDYFDVISIRRPGQFEMRIRCSEEIRRLPVKKMILQPLVENAMVHGFQDKEPPHILLIRCEVSHDGMLHIIVADNGSGIPADRLGEIQALFTQKPWEGSSCGAGIGLRNLCSHLSLAYKGKGTLKLSSRKGCYTQVELIFPAKIEPKEGQQGEIRL